MLCFWIKRHLKSFNKNVVLRYTCSTTRLYRNQQNETAPEFLNCTTSSMPDNIHMYMQFITPLSMENMTMSCVHINIQSTHENKTDTVN